MMDKSEQYQQAEGFIHSGKAQTAHERKKAYLRNYMLDYRKKHKRIELWFTMQEFTQLKAKADLFQSSRSAFCKAIVMSELLDLPLRLNASEIQQLQLDIRRIGNLINQVARRVNTTRQVYPSDVGEINKRLYDLEDLIALKLEHPKLFEHADQDCHTKSKQGGLQATG